MRLEEAQAFVAENKYRAFPRMEGLKSRCVDGRYPRMLRLPPLAKPGGDAGDLLAVLAVLRWLLDAKVFRASEEKVREKTLAAVAGVVGDASDFHRHTDEHAQGNGDLGCGHLRLASQHPGEYGLSPEDTFHLHRFMAGLAKKGMREVVLRGDHRESAVFIIESWEYSLYPSTNGGLQAFVYQKAFDELRLRTVANRVFAKVPEVRLVSEVALLKMLCEMTGKQLSATLRSLAPGLPIYEVRSLPGGLLHVAPRENISPK